MSTQLSQIAKKAKLDRTVRFTSLAHLLTPEFLTETWGMMNRRAASGIDGESTEQFESELKQRVEEICAQLRAGAYRAPPVRRVEIPKGPGKTGTRPLGIPTVADRLLQRAVARIIEAVFEADFLDCSYGFRPGRNPHHALQALRLQIVSKKVNHVFEADIRSYFTRISHQWLRKMVAYRIADPTILKLIGKWLKAGAMADGILISTKEGTPQGGPISPVLSNIYLHFTLDLWFEKRFKAQSQGEAYSCVSRMTLWEASSSWETRRTSSANCGNVLRSSIWNWPRRKLGCCSLGALQPSNGTSTDRGQRRLSF
jgi:group II intron reverse transcriptase/maturase